MNRKRFVSVFLCLLMMASTLPYGSQMVLAGETLLTEEEESILTDVQEIAPAEQEIVPFENIMPAGTEEAIPTGADGTASMPMEETAVSENTVSGTEEGSAAAEEILLETIEKTTEEVQDSEADEQTGAEEDVPGEEEAEEAEEEEELLQAKTVIHTVTAKSGSKKIEDIAKAGNPIDIPDITVISGAPAYFLLDSFNCYWERLRDDGTWEYYTFNEFSSEANPGFSPGTWRFSCQLRIDGSDAESYQLAEDGNINVTVDGKTWTTDGYTGYEYPGDPAYSYSRLTSPTVVVEEPATGFVFVNKDEFTIHTPMTGCPISTYFLKDGLYGPVSKDLITFSKVSGPDWINVGSDGYVSGTPAKAGINQKLVVSARGPFDVARSITIWVDKTKNPVSAVSASSDMASVCMVGNAVKAPAITVKTGSPAVVEELKWQKQNADGTWPKAYVTSGTFTDGTWRLAGQVRIGIFNQYNAEGSDGWTYILRDKVTLQVDGKSWTVMNPPRHNEYANFSYANIISPPFKLVSVKGVALDKSSLSLKKGDTYSMKATVSPANASNKKVTWSSSDASVASVDANGKVTAKKAGTATITATTVQGAKKAACSVQVVDKIPIISYRTHVQSIGWQSWKMNGEMSGTEGQSKRLEGINIMLSNLPYPGGIDYRTHVQTYGWQGWRSDGEMAGTSGEAKRLEAIQIRLAGEIAKYYDVYYQTHIQHFGWSGWAKNGEMCGSAGYSYRLEGIRIKLVKKGEAAPGSTANVFHQKSASSSSDVSKVSGALVGYNTHVQTYGWQDYVYDGAMAGTSGQSKRLEGIHIALVNKPYTGNIVYRTHVQTYGWQDWKKNGEMSGTSGESKRLEGIQIYLTGEMDKHYDVYYCVHAQTYGWLDWAKNGEMAGTSGLSKRLEGIKIIMVPKGGKAPGSTVKPNVVGGGGKLPDNPHKSS